MAANKPVTVVLSDETCPPLNIKYWVNFLLMTTFYILIKA